MAWSAPEYQVKENMTDLFVVIVKFSGMVTYEKIMSG